MTCGAVDAVVAVDTDSRLRMTAIAALISSVVVGGAGFDILGSDEVGITTKNARVKDEVGLVCRKTRV
jgi:hypothetical protein